MKPLPLGTIVEKINSEPGDGHQDGARGKLVMAPAPINLPNIGPMPEKMAVKAGKPHLAGTYMYFVEWDGMEGVPVGVSGKRIKKAQDAR